MMKKTALVLMLAAAPSAAVAGQEGDPQERADAVVRCIDIAAVEERVRCYDTAARALRDSLRTGDVALVKGEEARRARPTPSRVEARIASVRGAAESSWRLELDNGQSWRTLYAQRQAPPPAGSEVLIKRSFVGSYWLTVPGFGQVQVERVD